MSDILLDTQTTPPIPELGRSMLWLDSTNKGPATRDDTGRIEQYQKNVNTAAEVVSGVDTYLAGSKLTIPSWSGVQVGTVFKWTMFITKTPAGIAAPQWLIRLGANGVIGDLQRGSINGQAQTAVADTAVVEMLTVIRSVGEVNVQGIAAHSYHMNHAPAAAATGFSNLASHTPVILSTSVAFNTTQPFFAGLSVNPGASAVWTFELIIAEMWY